MLAWKAYDLIVILSNPIKKINEKFNRKQIIKPSKLSNNLMLKDEIIEVILKISEKTNRKQIKIIIMKSGL
jgi:hypothetical protein